MELSVYAIISAVNIGFNLIFLKFLFSHWREHKSLRYLLFAALFGALWQAKEFINAGFFVPESYRSLLWRIGDSMSVPLLVCAYYFQFYNFIGQTERWWRATLIWTGSAAAILFLLVSDLSYVNPLINPYSRAPYAAGIPSLILNIWQLVLFAMILAVLAIARVRLRKSGDPKKRQELRVISVGSFLAIFLAGITEIIMPNLGYTPFPMGGIGLTIFLGSILYGIYSFHFFD